MTPNIDQSFDYQSEEARLNFQGNVGSLLELKSYLLDRATKAKGRNKDGAFLTIHELETLDSWLVDVTTNLMANYQILNRTNKLLNLNCETMRRLLSGRTPSLKSLVK